MADDKASDMFKECAFAIIVSPGLIAKHAAEVKETLERNSGTAMIIAEGRYIKDWSTVTHIISATSDFKDYILSQEYMLPVVTRNWVTLCIMGSKGKLVQTRPYTPDPNMFFSDVVLSCGDIPQGDKDAIIGALVAMGGVDSNALTKTTTHICALSMDHPKCLEVTKRNLKTKIVLPHWFDDCLKLGKKINEGPYLLPDSKILTEEQEAALPQPDIAHLEGASSTAPVKVPVPIGSALRQLTVFAGKTVMISEDLEIGCRIRGILEELIERGRGKITTTVHNADFFICRWRDSRDYVFASRRGIDVGNLAWLYYLITYNRWTSPTRRLLHYPQPKDGLPGFKDLKITISNYGGEARTYLENLVVASGAEFTKSMKQDNTHLITARLAGEKCTAAAEWKIETINSLWLEESYAKCEVQPLTTKRYTHFPPRTNLGEIIGQTQFDTAALEAKHFPRDPTPSPDDPLPPRRKVMREKDRNTPVRKSGEDVVMAEEDDEEQEIPKPKMSAAKPPRAKRNSAVSEFSTPASNRRVSLGKENDTPSSTGSRRAKAKAIENIHGLAPDIALYEKEKKRKGTVWGGERAANNYEKARSLECSACPAQHEEEDEEESSDERAAKRQKSGRGAKGSMLPPRQMRLLITSYSPWTDAADKETKDKRKLRELGISVVDQPGQCTHLVAPAIVRTKKFLTALAWGPTVVSSEFIDVCLRKGEIVDTKLFMLKDPVNEKKFGVVLKDVIARATKNRRCLLRNVPVYCTADIQNGYATYKEIAESNGATFNVYRGKGGAKIKPTKPEEDSIGPEPVYLVTGTRPEERKLWTKFEEMAEAGNMIPHLVTTQWLLDAAMTQELKWDEKYLVVNAQSNS